MKKMILLISVILSMLCVTNVFAGEIDGIEGISVPEYQTVCGNLPYHDMYSAGGCVCFYPREEFYFSNGCLWQCVNCYTLLATENEPGNAAGLPIGKYASSAWYYSYDVSGLCFFYALSGSYCYGTSLPGYRFNYYYY
ncbi:MAG: hypothetical protein HUJ76_01465 [Parasporobacterium sp.]|nr:hypothetical protein [Parasporobacterium sp.]